MKIPQNKRIFAYLETIRELFILRKFTLPPEIKDSHSITKALDNLNERLEKMDVSQSAPIFIFSAGWRSGSTLLQRLIISSNEVMIWGEPLGGIGSIAKIAYLLKPISQRWPPDSFFKESNLYELTNEWIANVTPELRYLKKSHISYFENWLQMPAFEKFDIQRWGLKEVRLTIDHAKYLKWLFPQAKFLFIYRNPIEAYRSWKGNRWDRLWPHYYTSSPIVFAKHWRYLLKGFISEKEKVDGMLVRFEDLISGNVDLKAIAEHCCLTHINPSILKNKISMPKESYNRRKIKKKKKINMVEKKLLQYYSGNLLKTLYPLYSG